eukprot:scaffold25040_cov130-Isochrysis_galbana.AAC.7
MLPNAAMASHTRPLIRRARSRLSAGPAAIGVFPHVEQIRRSPQHLCLFAQRAAAEVLQLELGPRTLGVHPKAVVEGPFDGCHTARLVQQRHARGGAHLDRFFITAPHPAHLRARGDRCASRSACACRCVQRRIDRVLFSDKHVREKTLFLPESRYLGPTPDSPTTWLVACGPELLHLGFQYSDHQ